MSDAPRSQTLPLLPIKNAVLFPGLLMPLSIGRPRSIAAVEAAAESPDKHIMVVAQRNAEVAEPEQDDLYAIGTNAVVRQIGRGEEGIALVVLGIRRMKIQKVEAGDQGLQAQVVPLTLPEDDGDEVEALHRLVLELAGKVGTLVEPRASPEVTRVLLGHEDPIRLAYLIASTLGLEVDAQQALLECNSRLEALRLLHTHLSHELSVL